jgi:Protein of unknown function (DUF1360)
MANPIGLAPLEELALGALCVWRLTHLLNAEDGPARWLIRMRALAGTGFWGELLDCFYCLSLWVAAPVTVLVNASWRERPLVWLALSGAACLLEQSTKKPEPFTGLVYEDSQEAGDVLRQAKTEDCEPDSRK